MRSLVGRARHERARLEELRAEHGSKGALRERAKELLQLRGVTWETQAALEARVDAAATAPSEPPPAPALAREPLADSILAVQTWVRAAAPAPLRVSVVLPTRNRCDLVTRAIASVQAQTHHDWELLVVDDASDDATAERLAAIEDPRVRVLRGDGSGAGAARNAGLAAATGDVVAYLDDDNVMLPDWLASVAWAFDAHPEVDVLYGAAVRELPGDELPRIQLEEWSRTALAHGNLADMGAIAHRRGLPEARFDEDVRFGSDWDLLLRLTAEREPLRLPALAMVYTRSAPNRVSDEAEASEGYARVRERALRMRPLRVLGYNWMYPFITETYIGDELRALVPHGAEIAWYRAEPATSPMAVPEPLYEDLALAMAEFRPDVLVLHWAGYAESQLPVLERHGVPFAVRMHGFDLHPDVVARLQAHPLCIGVWTYPARDFDQLGDHALPPIFTNVDALPEPAAERDLLLSVSAGLPKKDFPTLVEAFGELRGVERRIVMGITKGFAELPGQVAESCEALGADPPLVQVNLTRDQVHALQARTSVLVYTLLPEIQFGMPMSIVEALCSGCCVVLPDRPECRDYAGPGFRGYRTAGDIVRHCREVLAGGPEIDAEREANRAYARERFCDPELGRRFHAQLVDALQRAPAPALR
jgi:glycosyltransferase involved in cell wall biosynthesis